MKNNLLLCVLIFSIINIYKLQAQENNYYFNFRPSIVPSTSAFLTKGNLRIEGARQFYLGIYEPRQFEEDTPLEKLEKFDALIGGQWLFVNGNKIGISYTMLDNITVGLAFLASRKFDGFFLQEEKLNNKLEYTPLATLYQANTNSLEISGSYHGNFNQYFTYEGRMALIFGRGTHKYWDTFHIPNPLTDDIYNEEEWVDDELRYGLFDHNFTGSIGFKFHQLNISLQVNAGYVSYFNLKAKDGIIYGKAVYNQMISMINDHRTEFYVDPAAIIGLNFKRWGIQITSALPWALHESKYIIEKPTFGIELTINILKGQEKTNQETQNK